MEDQNNNTAQNIPTTPEGLPPLPKKPQENMKENNESVKSGENKDESFTKDAVLKKKEAFLKKVKIGGFILIGIVAMISLVVFARVIYNKTKDTFKTQQTNESSQSSGDIININKDQPVVEDKWEIYSNDKYKIYFEYPKGDGLKVTDVSEDEFLIQVYSQDVVPQENPTGENMVKGYIFQVKPLKLEARDVESAVVVKKQAYESTCPETASFTDIIGTEVSDIEGRGFKIYNCNADYSVDFVATKNYVYEITQIYKGDVGFKQVYKSKVNQITSLLDIDQDIPEEAPFITYESKYKFSVSYPREMDSEYSNVPYPPQEKVEKILTVAENDDTDALGFFYVKVNQDFNFDTYVIEQLQILIDDYTVVKGRAPDGTQTDLTIGGQPAVEFSGYSWKGNDLVYVNIPNLSGVLVLSKTNISDDIYNSIIESIVFE